MRDPVLAMLWGARSLVAGSLVAAIAALAGACAVNVVDDGRPGASGSSGIPACDCPTCCDALCPLVPPADGDDCHEIGLVCEFGTDEGCPLAFTCSSGAWHVVPPSEGSACTTEGLACPYGSGLCDVAVCSGGAWHLEGGDGGCCDGGTCCADVACPDDPPEAGSTCAAAPPCNPSIACAYPEPCGGGTLTATCPNGVWELDAPTDCGCVAASHGACDARPACRWVGPACQGSPTIPTPRCEPIAGCASANDCPAGFDCRPVAVDPCPGGQCGACSVVIPECVPLD